jgi:hypothetical protein
MLSINPKSAEDLAQEYKEKSLVLFNKHLKISNRYRILNISLILIGMMFSLLVSFNISWCGLIVYIIFAALLSLRPETKVIEHTLSSQEYLRYKQIFDALEDFNDLPDIIERFDYYTMTNYI